MFENNDADKNKDPDAITKIIAISGSSFIFPFPSFFSLALPVRGVRRTASPKRRQKLPDGRPRPGKPSRRLRTHAF